MSEADRQAFVFSANFNRRNLSPSQKQDAGNKMKAIAKALKKEDKKANTQAIIALKLGVARETVRDWFMHNGGTAKTHKHDSRVKIPVQANPAIVDRIDAGESQEQVAADYGVLLAKAGIGEMMPPGEPGRGKKNPKAGLGFSEVTLTAYRKLADNKDQLPAYREAVTGQDSLLEITQAGAARMVGSLGSSLGG